ncbi:uncharacterized protein PG986_013163 [Apiospora aurea]|uniref:Uncharacterized protein n=1 Tax=Apiospora aurea TaxID=335848 RepID=A0ABR1PVB1_9PEZI
MPPGASGAEAGCSEACFLSTVCKAAEAQPGLGIGQRKTSHAAVVCAPRLDHRTSKKPWWDAREPIVRRGMRFADLSSYVGTILTLDARTGAEALVRWPMCGYGSPGSQGRQGGNRPSVMHPQRVVHRASCIPNLRPVATTFTAGKILAIVFIIPTRLFAQLTQLPLGAHEDTTETGPSRRLHQPPSPLIQTLQMRGYPAWGFVVVRTYYASEEQWQAFRKRLNVLCNAQIDEETGEGL